MHFKWAQSFIALSVAVLITCHGSDRCAADDDFPPTVCKETDAQMIVKGTVVDTNGNPISGASVYPGTHLDYIIDSVFALRKIRREAPVTTDSEGNYSIQMSSMSSSDGFGIHHMAIAPGYAPAAVFVPEKGELLIKLTTGREVAGRIMGPDGKPAANVRVQLTHWFAKIPKDQPQQLEQSQSASTVPGHYSAAMPGFGASNAVSTDDDGYFSMQNIPNHRVALVVKGTGLQEEDIYVRGLQDGKEETRGPDFASQLLVSNDFSWTAKACSTLTLNAVDEDGEPALIRHVILQPKMRQDNIEDFKVTVEIDSNNTINIPNLEYPIYAFVLPEDDTKLLGRRLEFPQLNKNDPRNIQHDVRFQHGVPVRGIVVDKRSGIGIEDVNIRWRSERDKNHDSNYNIPSTECRTDKGGTFEIVVPNTDGIAGVAGDVPGYRSIFAWNADERQEKSIDLDCISRYTEELESGNIESLPPLRFELSPSYRLNVALKLSDESRILEGKVICYQRNKSPFGRGWPSRERGAQVDSLGRCHFDHWYFDDLEMELAFEQTDQQKFRWYPSFVRAFTKNGYQGSATAPLPDPDDLSNEINMTMTLHAPGNVEGQIVNYDGQPVAGLKVTASTGHAASSGHVWTTETREDGRFLMADFPVGAAARWELDSAKVKTMNSARLELDLSELKSNFTLKLSPIKVLDLSYLSDPFPNVSITHPNNERAFETFRKFAKEQIAKLPTNTPEANAFLTSRSSYDPIAKFTDRLETELIRMAEDLADRDAGGEFELQVLSTVSSCFKLTESGQHLPFNEGRESLTFCFERLMKNQASNELAQAEILAVVDSLTAKDTDDRIKLWEEVHSKSPYRITKAAADSRLARFKLQEIRDKCLSNNQVKDFKTDLLELESKLNSALKTNRKLVGNEDAELIEQELMYIKDEVENALDPNEQSEGIRGTATNRTQLKMLVNLLNKYASAP